MELSAPLRIILDGKQVCISFFYHKQVLAEALGDASFEYEHKVVTVHHEVVWACGVQIHGLLTPVLDGRGFCVSYFVRFKSPWGSTPGTHSLGDWMVPSRSWTMGELSYASRGSIHDFSVAQYVAQSLYSLHRTLVATSEWTKPLNQAGVSGNILNWIELGEDSAQLCERSSNRSGFIMTAYVCDIVFS